MCVCVCVCVCFSPSIEVPTCQAAAVQGNTIGGLVGVVVHDLLTALGLGSYVWLASALAVSLTIVAQEVTRTVHPPGGTMRVLVVGIQ